MLKGFRKKGKNSTSSKKLIDKSPEPLTEADLVQTSVSFEECPPEDRNELLIRKLRLCQIGFDFRSLDPEKEEARNAKRNELMELVEYIGGTKGIFNETVLSELIELLESNMFRPLPPRDPSVFTTPDLEDEEVGAEDDPAWAHLQIVYELFLRFIVSGDVEIAVLSQFVNEAFVIRMLDIFCTQNRRERDYLKIILHRIYAKIMCMRSAIRGMIADVFTDYLNNPTSTSYTGISELLEVMAAIISGFTAPFKQEHVQFLDTILIPLHKAAYYKLFDRQLTYCVTQLVERDRSLAEPVIKGMIRYWPMCNSHKELSFLEELEDILELLPPEGFANLIVPICRVLSHAIATPHFQVTERVLYLWHNETIVTAIAKHIDQALPVLFPALHKHAESHWNASIHNLALNVLKIFMEIDQETMEKVAREFEEKKKDEDNRHKARQATWEMLDQRAKKAGLMVPAQ